MVIIETPRLVLRTWKESDLLPMTAINQDAVVMRYFPSLQGEQETLGFIKKVKAHQAERGFSFYAVELKSSRDFIGFVGLATPSFEAHFTPTIEIAWRLAQKYWNQGYASEAAQAVLHYAFHELELPEVVSFTVVENKASQRVMEKIGLTHNKEDDFDHPTLQKDHPFCRHVLYRITRDPQQNCKPRQVSKILLPEEKSQ